MTKTFTLHPCHFNATLTKKQGRKYGIKNCVQNPTCEEMKNACNKLELQVDVQDNKRHPRDQDVYGRLMFAKNIDRYIVVAALKQEINAERLRQKEKKEQKEKILSKQEKKEIITENKESGQKSVKILVAKRKKSKTEKKKNRITSK